MSRSARDSHHGRLRRWMSVATLCCVALSACGTSASNVKPPNISSAMAQTLGQTRRTRLILQVLDKDIDQAKQLRNDFFAVKPSSYSSPYPIDLFKQTAMSCLNQPMSITREGVEETEAFKRVKPVLSAYNKSITCAPPTLPQLITSVTRNTPRALALTLSQLERVDALRALRSRVRARTSKLTPLLRQQRLYLDQQRLDLRRLRQKVNRQRRDYDNADYVRARKELDAHQRALNDYEAAIKAIEVRKKAWRGQLQEQLKQFYFQLAGLYAEAPFESTP